MFKLELVTSRLDFYPLCLYVSQKSSSSESLSEKGSAELKKSFDAVVFDVLKVTPEEYAVRHACCLFVSV